MHKYITLKTLLLGFIAGALATLVFHQSMILVLHLMKQVPNFPWSMRAVGPLGVPAIVNSMFWGGLWGSVFAVIGHAVPGGAAWLRGIVFGLLGPWLLGNGILVPLFKGGPFLFGFAVPRMIVGALIGSAFGLGVALILGAIRRRA
jgi:hypothetical protein